MADDHREQDNARRLSLARAGGFSQPGSAVNRTADRLAKLTPSGWAGKAASKLGVDKRVGWVIGCLGCGGCLTAAVWALIPILLLTVGCKVLNIC